MSFFQFQSKFMLNMENNGLWIHPYFQLIRQQPSLKILQQWAIQAGMIDEIFAAILQSLIDNPCIPTFTHTEIRKNLNDELGNGDPNQEHFKLFQSVLGNLGISLDQYRNTSPLLGTAVILRGLRNAVVGDPVRALAIMASEELICPREFPILMRAIENILGNKNDWYPYFQVHCEADVRHSTDLIRDLYRICENDNQKISHAYDCQIEDLQWNCVFYDSLLLAGDKSM